MHDMINVSDSSQTRSDHESEMFDVGCETLRGRTERSVIDHDVSHERIMVNETEMDFRNFRTSTLRCEARAEYQRSRIDSEN